MIVFDVFFRGKTSQRLNNVLGASKEEVLKIISENLDDLPELKFKIKKRNGGK